MMNCENIKLDLSLDHTTEATKRKLPILNFKNIWLRANEKGKEHILMLLIASKDNPKVGFEIDPKRESVSFK